jgi:hypothetical protein
MAIYHPASRLARFLRRYGVYVVLPTLLLVLAGTAMVARVTAGDPGSRRRILGNPCPQVEYCPPDEMGGQWVWARSSEEDKRAVAAIFNRYCIRCHGVDGRGVWDIPDVPDFTNPRWQACRSDSRLADIILQGRGAVMPPFRGTLSLEQAWAMGRYLRTFVPGTEVSPPDYKEPAKTSGAPQSTPTVKIPAPPAPAASR